MTYRTGKTVPNTLMDIIDARTDRDGPVPSHQPHLGPCHVWQAGRSADGYAQLHVDGKTRYVHRLVVEHLLGQPLGPGVEVRHRCDNPPCVNPDHLEPGSHAENMRDLAVRGRGRNKHTGKTHCIRGHPLSGDNLYVMPSGGRACRACGREKARRRRREAGVRPKGSRTHCGRGHEFTPENTRWKASGSRACRACEEIYSKERWSRVKEAARNA